MTVPIDSFGRAAAAYAKAARGEPPLEAVAWRRAMRGSRGSRIGASAPAAPISMTFNSDMLTFSPANHSSRTLAVAGGRQSFADMVRGALDDAVAGGRESEKASVAAVEQGADLNHVVTAVAEAELTLQTVVAVRERIIEAYKDILRMPI